MFMSGTNQSKVTVTLRNPLNHNDLLEYYIIPDNTILAKDWIAALKTLLIDGNLLEKNFCFMGFPKTARTLEYLCNLLNQHIEIINKFDFTLHGLENYIIEEWFHPNTVRFPDSYPIEGTMLKPGTIDGQRRTNIGLYAKHTILNQLHNHFECLQGTVNNLSPYYKVANYKTKYAIRQLNIICHEMESLILSQRKQASMPEWVRPSQITTFLHANRYKLCDEHRAGFNTNGYDRKFAHVYMHWAQIGKTLMEVFRDEDAPKLTDTVCDAINSLEYYSGEFDVEWGKDVTRANNYPWVEKLTTEFTSWLLENGLDPTDPKLSLGHLPIGQIDLIASFGTEDMFEIWDKISDYLDIYKIKVDNIEGIFEYVWSDTNYEKQQIDMMKPGYDFSSRKG
jgi:hypothetical protein